LHLKIAIAYSIIPWAARHSSSALPTRVEQSTPSSDDDPPDAESSDEESPVLEQAAMPSAMNDTSSTARNFLRNSSKFIFLFLLSLMFVEK
jgi:hypothetical protein